nr:hypothetical protein [Tanacetum cinerariifolium]
METINMACNGETLVQANGAGGVVVEVVRVEGSGENGGKWREKGLLRKAGYTVRCTVFQNVRTGKVTFDDDFFFILEHLIFEGKSASTPIDAEKPLLKDSDGEDVDVHTYRSMIGSLMYLTSSRPDILFAVCACARFQVTPKVSHLNAVKRLFRYLKGKPYLGLWYPKDSLFDIVAYSDSDYAEAEYIAATSGCAQVLWIQNQLLDYGYNCMHTFWNNASVTRSGDVTRLQALVDKEKIVLSENQLGDLSTHTTRFISSALTQKVFANMRRVGKGFSGVETPLFKGMFTVRQPAEEGVAEAQVQADDVVAAAVEEIVTEDGADFPTHIQQVLDVCSALTRHVENLENDKADQKLEIIKLKARVKKLEMDNKVKSSKLRRLRKVGASRRVKSSDDMDDVFNQGRMIDDMDKDEGIELVKDAAIAEIEGRHAAQQAEKQAEIYNLDLDHSSKVLSMQEDDSDVQDVVEIVTTAKLITDVVTAASQVSAASATISAAKPSILAAAPTVVAAYTRRRKGDAAMDHVNQKSKNPQYIKRYQGMKKRPQTESEARKNMMIYLKNTAGYKMDFFKGMTYAEISKRRKLSEEAQEAEDPMKHLEVVDDEDDDVFIEATPLARKVPVVDYQIVLVDNKPRFKIIKADETHQFYISFTTLLKNFDIEDLENLWGIVKKIFSTSKPTNFSDEYLLLTLKTMFEKPDEQDAVWKNQRSVHGLALVKS